MTDSRYFLIFILYAYAANAYTQATSKLKSKHFLIGLFILGLITVVALYDQIPIGAAKGDPVAKALFLSERKFVEKIEATLPQGAMVYQYPYSQYLRENKYYGWGSFSHVRLYLHSKTLRWSNGAAKNSAVENWHIRMTHLPLIEMLNELQAVGFRGLVIDKAVLSDSEYLKVKEAIQVFGLQVTEDSASKLAFAKFNQAAFKVEYSKDYKNIDKLFILNRALVNTSKPPVLINALALNHYLDSQPKDKNYLVINRVDQPQIFLNGNLLTRGTGEQPILPLTDMKGALNCALTSGKLSASMNDVAILTIQNNSDFDWHFDSGSFPIRIGIHLQDNENKLIRWDDGLRVSGLVADGQNSEVISGGMETFYIRRGSAGEIKFPLSKLNLGDINNKSLIADFRLVQDGHAWFEHLGCKIKIEN